MLMKYALYSMVNGITICVLYVISDKMLNGYFKTYGIEIWQHYKDFDGSPNEVIDPDINPFPKQAL